MSVLFNFNYNDQPTNSTIPQPLWTHGAPTYQISAKSNNSWLSLMTERIFAVHFSGGCQPAISSQALSGLNYTTFGEIRGPSEALPKVFFYISQMLLRFITGAPLM